MVSHTFDCQIRCVRCFLGAQYRSYNWPIIISSVYRIISNNGVRLFRIWTMYTRQTSIALNPRWNSLRRPKETLPVIVAGVWNINAQVNKCLLSRRITLFKQLGSVKKCKSTNCRCLFQNACMNYWHIGMFRVTFHSQLRVNLLLLKYPLKNLNLFRCKSVALKYW